MTRLWFRIWRIRLTFIPDKEKLWRALHRADQVYKETGRPKPSFFRDRSGLSCDLARFSTPERSRRGHGPKPYPPECGLVEISTALVREAGSDVAHVPVNEVPRNYAHTQFVSVVAGEGLELLARESTYRIHHRFRDR